MTSNRYYYNIYGYNNSILYMQSAKYVDIRHNNMYNILLYLCFFLYIPVIYLYDKPCR